MEKLDEIDGERIALMAEAAQMLLDTFERGSFQMIALDADGQEMAYELTFRRGDEAIGQQNAEFN